MSDVTRLIARAREIAPFSEDEQLLFDLARELEKASNADHIEYAAAHKHAGLAITDEDGDLFTDLDDIKWVYEEYPNVTLMQRTVGPWVAVEETK